MRSRSAQIAWIVNEWVQNLKNPDPIQASLEEMAVGQKFIPDRGYDAPLRTRNECDTPAFADHRLHRVGFFRGAWWGDDGGLPGYSYFRKCVNCGREFGNAFFVPGAKVSQAEA